MNASHETTAQAGGRTIAAVGVPVETSTAITGENARVRINGLYVWLSPLAVAALLVVFTSCRIPAGRPPAPAKPAIR
jgi:hypothetical protein